MTTGALIGCDRGGQHSEGARRAGQVPRLSLRDGAPPCDVQHNSSVTNASAAILLVKELSTSPALNHPPVMLPGPADGSDGSSGQLAGLRLDPASA